MSIVDIIYRYATQRAQTRPRPGDSTAACRRLDEGNRVFAQLLTGGVAGSGIRQRIIGVDARDLGLDADGSGASEQRPFAAVLGCSDARVPIELIFNEGPNDLFVVRVAGNGLGADVLGSLTYAVEHLGGSMKLIVVLGHSGCGAVSTAVDVFLNPAEYLPLAGEHSLRSVLDRVLVVVQACARRFSQVHGPAVTQRPGYREALTEAAIVTNAALVAHTLQQQMGSGEPDGLRAVYGVYLLATRRIWAPQEGGAEWAGLASPPGEVAGFVAFSDVVARSERIVGILDAR